MAIKTVCSDDTSNCLVDRMQTVYVLKQVVYIITNGL